MTEPTAQIAEAVKVVSDSKTINEAIGTFAQYMAEMTDKYGQDFVNLMLNVVQLSGLNTIVNGIVDIGIAFGLYKIAEFLIKNKNPDFDLMSESNFFTAMGAIILWIVTIVIAIIGISNILDMWAWVKLIMPQIGFAHIVMNKFI